MSAAAGGRDDGTPSVLPVKPARPTTAKVACLDCRRIKVKCRLPDGSLPELGSADCARCVRLELSCRYQKAKPPLHRNTRKTARSTVAAGGPTTGFTPRDNHHTVAPTGAPLYPAFTALPTPTLLAIHAGAEPHDNISADSGGPSTTPHRPFGSSLSPASCAAGSTGSTAAPGRTSETGIAASLADATRERSSTFVTNAPTAPSVASTSQAVPATRHPIDLHMLSSAEANQLVTAFHQDLNPLIRLLDPYLHSLDYLRHASPLLLSAVLAVSSEFFRTDLYRALLEYAQQSVSCALGSTKGLDVSTIQAILLLDYWKEPFDSSAWLRVGFAIRLAYQLGLHRPRQTPLPSEDTAARIQLDRERTWVVLIETDSLYLVVETRAETRMITSHSVDIDAWLAETDRFGVVSDREHGISLGLAEIRPHYQDIARASCKELAQSQMAHLRQTLLSVRTRYLDPTSPLYRPLTRQSALKGMLHWLAGKNALAQSYLLVTGAEDHAALHDYLESAGELTDHFIEVVESGLFGFMHDIVGLHLLAAGEFFGKLFPQVDASIQSLLGKWTMQIYLVMNGASGGRTDVQAAFVARFFGCVLKVIRPGVLPVTAPASPRATSISDTNGHGEGGVAGVVETEGSTYDGNTFTFPNDLDLDMFGSMAADAVLHDATYWDSLNAASIGSSWAWLESVLGVEVSGVQT